MNIVHDEKLKLQKNVFLSNEYNMMLNIIIISIAR